MGRLWLRRSHLRKRGRMADLTAGSTLSSRGCSTTWLTCDEVAFVQALGTHNEASVKVSRVVWFMRYVEVARLRVEWGKIDKVAVLKEAGRLLRLEQRKASKKAP